MNMTRLAEFDLLTADPGDDCIIWPHGKNQDGYGDVKLGGHHYPLHRRSCFLWLGPPSDPGLQVAHGCGVRACINPLHLRWATVAENAADRAAHGTNRLGAANNKTKLTEEQVRAIRRDLTVGRPKRQIAREYGVAKFAIECIANGKSWAWLDAAPVQQQDHHQQKAPTS